jgi:valyl-tRNA synthetase
MKRKSLLWRGLLSFFVLTHVACEQKQEAKSNTDVMMMKQLITEIKNSNAESQIKNSEGMQAMQNALLASNKELQEMIKGNEKEISALQTRLVSMETIITAQKQVQQHAQQIQQVVERPVQPQESETQRIAREQKEALDRARAQGKIPIPLNEPVLIPR